MDWLGLFKYAGYVIIVLGVICSAIVDHLNDKEDKQKEIQQQSQMNELSKDVKESKKMLEPFSDLAGKLYPGLDQKDALEKLKSRLDTLDQRVQEGKEKIDTLSSDLSIDKRTIKSFEVEVSIEFSGEWKDTPYPIWYQPPLPRPFMRWIDNAKKLPDIEFSTARINNNTLNANTGLFKNTLVVQPGQFPLGQLTDALKDYDHMAFWMLWTNPRNLTSPIITINKVDLVFFINGTKKGELHYHEKMMTDYSKDLNNIPPDQNTNLTPTIELNGKPIDILKFDL